MQQAVQNTRLRPLPPRGAVLSSMMIEGSKTGEEKIFNPIEKREAPTKPPKEPVERERKEPDNAKELQRIRKLEAELRKVTELVKGRNSELGVLKNTLMTLEDRLCNVQNQLLEAQKT